MENCEGFIDQAINARLILRCFDLLLHNLHPITSESQDRAYQLNLSVDKILKCDYIIKEASTKDELIFGEVQNCYDDKHILEDVAKLAIITKNALLLKIKNKVSGDGKGDILYGL